VIGASLSRQFCWKTLVTNNSESGRRLTFTGYLKKRVTRTQGTGPTWTTQIE
jgi:hypothetical protein